MAKKASQIGAKVIALTASPTSLLTTYATHVIHIPSPLDPSVKIAGISTRQPARSLFEQAMLIYLESIVMELIDRLKIPREKIEKRHANLE
jgi:6-phospho-3-hexuloisomerase